jgi:hypothetical protein
MPKSTPRLVKFKCVVTSVTTPKIALNDHEITLTKSGSDWSGSDSVQVTDTVEIHPKVGGVDGDDWAVTVTTDCSNGATPDKIFTHSGQIPNNSHGVFEFIVTSPVPASPCSSNK